MEATWAEHFGEDGDLRAWVIVCLGFVAFAALGTGVWFVNHAAPACDSARILRRVTETLRDRDHLEGIFINNIQVVSGGLFVRSRQCSAEVAPIRSNVEAAAMVWRRLDYQIDRPDKSVSATVATVLGPEIPLSKPALSWWEWVKSWF